MTELYRVIRLGSDSDISRTSIGFGSEFEIEEIVMNKAV